MYRMKHVPTGLYFQPYKHRGSHLSKTGKVYHTNVNGVQSERGYTTFRVRCQKNSRIHKQTDTILNWKSCTWSNNEVTAETDFKDWIKEEI